MLAAGPRSPRPGTEPGALRLGLDPACPRVSRDSVWFGLARWRELVAQFFDASCNPESLKRIESVHIEVLSPDAARPRGSRSGWRPGSPASSAGSRRANRSIPSEDSQSNLAATFTGPSGTVRVNVVTGPLPAGLAGTPRLSAWSSRRRPHADPRCSASVAPSPDSPAVRVDVEAIDTCSLPRMIDAPELDPARRIAAALESSRLDPPFQRALPMALWLMEYKQT